MEDEVSILEDRAETQSESAYAWRYVLLFDLTITCVMFLMCQVLFYLLFKY